jgi:ornithine carbamoyltransferase
VDEIAEKAQEQQFQGTYNNGCTHKKHPRECSAQYMTLPIKIGSTEVKTCWFGSTMWIWLSIAVQFTKAGKRHKLAASAPFREECNKYNLTGALCF